MMYEATLTSRPPEASPKPPYIHAVREIVKEDFNDPMKRLEFSLICHKNNLFIVRIEEDFRRNSLMVFLAKEGELPYE